jgi:hypothetical protein
MMLGACNNNGSSDSDNTVPIGTGDGGTKGGDGSGGGEVNEDGLIFNVDYGQKVDEDKLGLPKDPSEVLRFSKYEIPIYYSYSAFSTSLAPETSLTDPFDPASTKSYKIAVPELKIIDSAGDAHDLVLYLIPTDIPSGTDVAFQVYATVNNIGISLIRRNQSHTSLYVKGAYVPKFTEFVTSSTIYNQDMMTIPDGAIEPTLWHGALIYPNTSILYPASTKYPCFKKHMVCDKLDDGNSNYDRVHFLLQPLATMGYKDFDWFEYVFKDSDLNTHPLTNTPLTNDIKDKAIAETLERLKETTLADNTPDIGWYGLPLEKRNHMIRYHSVQIELSFTEDDTNLSDTDLVILENSIKMVHYTKGFDSDETLKTVTHAQLTAEHKTH